MTEFPSFLRLNNIPFSLSVQAIQSHLFYQFIWWFTLKLLPHLGYCEQWCPPDTDSFFPLDMNLDMGFLGQMAILFFIVWGTVAPVSIMAVMIYIRINSIQEVSFLHSLTITCYLFFLITAILLVVRWLLYCDFSFVNLWGLVTPSIFHLPVGHA